MTAAELAEKGVVVFDRPSGRVVMTRAGYNSEGFRRQVLAWLQTDEGAAWLAEQRRLR